MKSYTIHLIRHGLTKGNLEARYVGHTDLPLCSQGIRQIKEILRAHPYPKAQAYFSSPLKRCLQTLELIYPGVPPLVIPDLIEYNFGEFEGLTAQELENSDAFRAWLKGDAHARPPYGESNMEFTARICDAFKMIVEGLMKTGTTQSVICAHSGVIMTLLEAFGLPQAPVSQWTMDPGFGYTVRVTPGVWMRSNKMEVIDTFPIPLEELRQEEEPT